MATQSSSSGIGASSKARAKILMMPHLEPYCTSPKPPAGLWISRWRRNSRRPFACIATRRLKQRARALWKTALITMIFWLALSWLAVRVLLGGL
ncbi:MAG TPA: hypothetical protein VEG30_19225 [Terriglobales bacterium]|nr:hypothetical protein [Terriglobales bacterium]